MKPRMTEADKLLALIASAAALFVHRYADLPLIHVPAIKMLKAAQGGIPTD
jgi:hypothetical protein